MSIETKRNNGGQTNGRPRRKVNSSRAPKTLNVTEQHQLLESLLCKDAPTKTFRKGVRNYLIACLMLEAGLRVGEVTALQIKHLYFHSFPVMTLLLESSVTKNNVERTIPISTRLHNAMAEYWSMHTHLHHMLDETSVWCRPDANNALTTRQVERIITAAGLTAINRPVNPHMLRHTFATKLMRVTDTKTVQQLLGHSDMGSTQIYMHPNEQDKKLAIDRLDEPANGQ